MQIDFEAVAEGYGFGSAGVARTRFGQVRRHMMAALEDNQNGTVVTPKKTGEKKRKMAEDFDLTAAKRKTGKVDSVKKEEPHTHEDYSPLSVNSLLNEDDHITPIKKEIKEDDDN